MPAFRHLRGLVAALTALLLTAGIVLGAQELMPAAAEGGLQRAEEASGTEVPVRAADDEEATDDEDADATEDATDDEEPADDEEGTEDEVEDTTDDDGAHPDNHGATVSEAARGETPEGYRNHGEYVSEVARDKGDSDEPTDEPTDDPTADEPTASAANGSGKPAKGNKGNNGKHGKSGTSKRGAGN
jgi:hypothetical protein